MASPFEEEMNSQLGKMNSSGETKDAVFKFVWHLTNFRKDFCVFRQRIRSPEFALQSFSSSKYCFDFYPRGRTQEQKDKYSSVYLVQTKGPEKFERIGFTCSVSDTEGVSSPPLLPSPKPVIPKKNAAWVHPYDTFPECHFTFEVDIYFGSASDEDDPNNEYLQELSNDLLKAYEEHLHPDMTLLAYGVNYKVHSALIGSRYPQLRAASALDERMKQEVFETLLLYLYSGKLDRRNLSIGFYDVLSNCKDSKMHSILLANRRKMKVETCFTEKSVSFTWRIKNFGNLKPDESLSHFFMADEYTTWTWFQVSLKIADPAEVDGPESKCSISMLRYSKECKFIACTVKIGGTENTFRHSFGSENAWDIASFVPRKALAADQLNISFEISVLDGSCTSDVKESHYHPFIDDSDSQHPGNLKLLQGDMEKLLPGSKVGDFKLIVDFTALDVHKFILCARSPVFRELIAEKTGLEEKPELTIQKFDVSVVKSMLRFIYCADVDITSVEHAVRLYAAANVYEIPGLKKRCAADLKSRLTPENAGRVLLTADEYADEELTELVMDFICSNSMSVLSSIEWDRVKENAELVKKLLEACMKRLEVRKAQT